ncbi:MAG: cytochrome b/b6 domain-containing protein [Pseudomonadota bacterium]
MSDITATGSNPSHRYTSVAIALHWVIALAILSLIPGGWFMTDLPNDHVLKEGLYQLHKSVGITILILTLARIIWRVMNPPPADASGLTGWEKTASHAAHYAFYALMLALPLTGWLYVSTAYDFDIPTVLYGIVSWPDLPFVGFLANESGHGAVEFVHSKLAWLALALVAVHVAGALKHEFGPEEGVLKRMIPGLFGKTGGPRAPSRGALSAFGGALAVFAAVAVTPVLAQGSAADVSGGSELEANWTINRDANPYIRFSGMHDGSQYTGSFENWDAVIAFDPDNLAASRVEVTVDLASAIANKKLYTDSLRAAEWLDVSGAQTATVVLDLFDGAEPNYTANAALTLKGATIDVPLDFELYFEGDEAFMEGETVLSRAELDVGMESDPGGDWVSDEIRIEVSLAAKRVTD